MTTANNPLGQDFRDPKNWDDITPGQELYLPVGKKVRVRITAKDVLHSFFLPQFRVKMDAVPGMPTYFVFTPVKTTAEFRNELKKYPEYNEPFDPADPKGPKRWEKFDYELACAELCGKGHYSMRRVFKIVSQEEFDAWYAKQESFYKTQIRGKEDDPNRGKYLNQDEFLTTVKKAAESTTATDKTLQFRAVTFETGSTKLTAESHEELDYLVSSLTAIPGISLEVAGHTDNVGEPEANKKLSEQRATEVVSYLTARGVAASRLHPVGYGEAKPLVPNDSPDNRAKNRRTEFTILGGKNL
jgi:cytochrome c oxidase subunit 2